MITREEGLHILTGRGWLSGTPTAFQRAVLAGCRWYRVEAGDPIQTGGEDVGELTGLAQGTLAMSTILGAPGTPIMHLAHPPFWFGYFPIIFGQPRGISATARTPVWLAGVPQARVRRLLADRPAWWEHFLPLALVYGDTVVTIAADLLIRDSERRCAAVLLWLGGRRFADPADAAPVEVPVTQEELAAAANLSRNTAGTVLRKLAARGLIEPGYRGVTMRAPTALRAVVDAA